MPNDRADKPIQCEREYGGNCWSKRCVSTGICGPTDAEVAAHKKTLLRKAELSKFAARQEGGKA
jgi:hypothetical protein